MKFMSFIALVSLSASVFGANVDTFRPDVQHLAASVTSWGNAVTAFPRTIRAGVTVTIYDVVKYSGIALKDLGVLVNRAISLKAPLAADDGLALVALFDPIAQDTISALQALQDRKVVIAAIPSLGPLALWANTTLTFKAAFAKSVFTADALNAWNALFEGVIDVENATNLLFDSA